MSLLTLTLKALPREQTGKRATKEIRNRALVPAIIYSKGETPLHICIEEGHLGSYLRTPGVASKVCHLGYQDKTITVLPKELQRHVVTDKPLHCDFIRVGKDTMITTAVSVVFENEDQSIGLKRGGVLNIVRHTIDLVCPVYEIPQNIAVDLTGADIGFSVHMSHLTLPEGIRPSITDRDFTIATISAPSVIEEEEEAPEEEEEEGATDDKVEDKKETP